MRIVVLNDHAGVTGGAAQVAISGLNALADSGFEVTFVAAVGPVTPLIDQSRVRVICYGHHDSLSNPSRLEAAICGVWDSRCSNQLGQLLSTYDPDDTIIHLHTWVKSLSSSVIYEIRSRGFKLVCTLHDFFSICPNGGMFNYVTNKHCIIEPMSMSCLLTNCDARSYSQKIWRFGRHFVQKHISGMPDQIEHFISISDYSEKILKCFLPSTASIYRVRNPIAIDRLPLSDASRNQVFSFIGRLSPEKGAILFAKSAKIAKVPAQFVGSGVEGGLIPDIYPAARLQGWQDRAGVVRALQSSRALVFPSLWHETQGLIVLEAAALGIPSIVSDECAAREFISDGKTGLLFKSGNVDDLVQKINLLHNDLELASQLGKCAYERYWSDPCTLESHIHDLVACYRQIVL